MKLVAAKSLSGVAAGMAALSLFVSGVVLTSAPVMVSPDRKDASSGSEAATKKAVQEAVAQLPLAFEPNRGQTDGRVDFLARGPGYSAFLTPSQAILKVGRPSAGQESVLRMQLVGSNPDAKAAGRNVLRGKVNYLKGPQSNWVKNVPTFSKVRYSNVYPGIDLAYYGNQRNLEYDLVVKPGADPSQAKLLFEGADRVVPRPNGDLAVTVGDETFVQRRPYAYQDNGGARKEIPSAFRVKGTTVTFDLGSYDTTRTLVIDPVINYSTFMGGAGADVGFGVAVDGAGNAYLTGSTQSANFPCGTGTRPRDSQDVTTPNDPTPACSPITSSYQGRQKLLDAFVIKVDTNAAGFNSLAWSTYLGGDSDDVGFDVAVDEAGNVYVAGATQSSDDPGTRGTEKAFPTTENAYDKECGTDGHCNAPMPDRTPFVAIEGTPKLYQCYPHADPGTTQTNCPTSPVPDAFVSVLNPTGTALMYSTFLGGSDFEHEPNPAAGALGHMDIAVQGTKAFVASTTASSDFPTTINNVDRICGTGGCNGQTDGFLVVLDTAKAKQESLLVSTFIGGDGADVAKGVAVDGDGNAYVGGTTHGIPGSPVANNFPTTNGQAYFGGPSDGFLAKFQTAALIQGKLKGTLPAYSMYLGGGGTDEVWDVAVHRERAYATGFTDSGNDPKTSEADGPQPYFPTTAGAYDTSFNGEATRTEEPTNSFANGDAFVTQLRKSGTIAYSTYLGGIHGDVGHGIAVDSDGFAYVTGYTMCRNQTREFRTNSNGVLEPVPDSEEVCDDPAYPRGSFPLKDPVQEDKYGNRVQPEMGSAFLGAELHNSPTDGFASRLNLAGGGDSDLVFSTYVGGNNFDRGYAIAVRETGLNKEIKEIYVTGRTGSTDYLVVDGFTTYKRCLLLDKNPPHSCIEMGFKPSLRGNRDAYLMKITL